MIKVRMHFEWTTDPATFPEHGDMFSQSITQQVEADKIPVNGLTKIQVIRYTICHRIVSVKANAVLKSTAHVNFFIEDQEEEMRKDFLVALLEEGYGRFEDALGGKLQDTIYFPDLLLPEFNEKDVIDQIQNILKDD
jgi:hypothetical protein